MKRWHRWIDRSAATLVALAALAALVAFVACGGSPTTPITELDWDRTAPLSGSVVDGAVQVRAAEDGGSFPLTTIEAPDVGGAGYAIEGEVRYAGVSSTGFLEMWSEFPDGGRFFSRTLDTTGPLAAIRGDSAWRPFQLPFFLEGATRVPSSLEVNVVLPGSGTVWVGPLRLVPLGGDAVAQGAWWSDRTGGLLGGVGGAAVGIIGGLVGMLASRGSARRLVLGTLVVLGAVGVGSLVLGLVALGLSQPYAVTGTLFLAGALLTVLSPVVLRQTKAAYARAELRKMRALDATA